MTINTLIAQGGRNVASPVERYMEAREQVGRERRGALVEQQAVQQMNINRQKMQLAQDEVTTRNMASLAKHIEKVPDEKKEEVFKASLPNLAKSGAMPFAPNETYETAKEKLNQAKLEVYGEPKGEAVNVIHEGKLKTAIEDESGNYLDEKTRKPIYGAVKAPTRQETGEPGSFGLSKSGINKLEQEAVEQEKNIYKLAGGLNELENFIKSPDYIGGTTGDVVSIGNSIVAQIRQVTGNEGEITDEDVENKEGEYSRLRRAAQLGDQKASLIIDMAYQIAKMNDPGGRVTDADFKFSGNIIDGSADRESTLKKIDNYRNRQINNYNMSEKVTSERTKRQPRLFSDEKFRDYYDIEAPTDETTADAEKLKRDIYKDFGL